MTGAGPLIGLKVVEIGAIGPVTHAMRMLADLGADVDRVARPAGTDGALFEDLQDTALRGRRQLAADLKATKADSSCSTWRPCRRAGRGFPSRRLRAAENSPHRLRQNTAFHGIGAHLTARLAADSVIETEMTSEIPREADQLDYGDEAKHNQGGEQSDGTRPGADPGKGKDQE
jgi:hypothetical protein